MNTFRLPDNLWLLLIQRDGGGSAAIAVLFDEGACRAWGQIFTRLFGAVTACVAHVHGVAL
jgi:hypothetical protein